MNLVPDKINVKGLVTIRRFSSTGKLVSEITNNNLVVNSGLTYFCEKLLNINTDTIDSIGIGTGTSPANENDNFNTFTELVKKPIRFKRNQSINELFIESVFAEYEFVNRLVSEVGLFTNNNILIARTVLGQNQTFVKRDDEYLSVAWKITIG